MGKIFVFVLILCVSRAQIIGEGLISNLLKSASEFTGGAVASSVESLTSVPLAVNRALGFIGGVPVLVNDNNIVDLTSKVVGDVNAGSGNEDVRLNVTGLLLKYGKSVEEHHVQTKDGYELTIFRIPATGPAVFLMHGLLGSADDYVMMGPDVSLAFFLSDAGFDVWLGNARGNKYSRKHLNLHPSDPAFWDFSWHEIGIYDLPAMIDYALQESGNTKIGYVGHSQGTTTFFVMASKLPEYNDKISVMIALSPVAYMSHVRSPVVRLMTLNGPMLHALLKTVGIYEFLPERSVVKVLGRAMCGLGPLSDILCSNIVFLMAGFSFSQLDTAKLPIMLGHFPSGAATKQFVHYGQSVVTGDFRQFDYGALVNLERYGSTTPPRYDLGQVSAPVSLFYSDDDWLSHPTDVDKLYSELPNAVDIHKLPGFNHLDYVTGKDAKDVVGVRVLKLLTHFKSN